MQGQPNDDALRANLALSPTQRLEALRSLPMPQPSAVERASSYGIDISLLELALTWTPTERLKRLAAMINLVQTLQAAGARQHGLRDNPPPPR